MTGPDARDAKTPPPIRGGSVLLRLFLGAVVAAIAAFLYVDAKAPLDPSKPPHLFTPIQLGLMQIFPERCPAALARAEGVRVTSASRPIENGCGHPDGVVLSRSGVSYGGGVLLRCPAAVALVMWERNVLQPAARQHFGQPVNSVQTFGTYSCRNVYGREEGRRSQHATANAIDVAGIMLADGQNISVLRDWKDTGARGAFLREIRNGACRTFGAVLSPDYNAAHANHFHFDMGLWMVCR